MVHRSISAIGPRSTNSSGKRPTRSARSDKIESKHSREVPRMTSPTPPLRPVVVLGSINTDLVVRAPRFPRPGETIHGSDFAVIGGGKGANQATAAGRLGAPVEFIGAVGDDDLGARRLEELVAAGVDTRAIKR